jgi:threonine 3-dehydrogenase
MVMPDAIKALLNLEAASKHTLHQMVYNVTSFSPTAQNIYDVVKRFFPQAEITFKVHEKRQKIVDSWPAEIDDSAARRDWGWQPDYDLERSFGEYLIPAIFEWYQNER